MILTVLRCFMRFGDSSSKCFPTAMEARGSPWLFATCTSCKHSQLPALSCLLFQMFWFVLWKRHLSFLKWHLRNMTNNLVYAEMVHNYRCFHCSWLNSWQLLIWGDKIVWCCFLPLSWSSHNTDSWATPRADAKAEQIYMNLHHSHNDKPQSGERWNRRKEHHKHLSLSVVVSW